MKKTLILFSMIISIWKTEAQTTLGLVAYWPLDGNYIDYGPNGIHGTNVGSTPTTNAGNTPNRAMLFLNPSSAVPQYATHPVNSNVNFSGTQNFTIAFKVYVNSPYVHTGGFYDNNLNYGGPGVWFWDVSGVKKIQFNYKNNSIASTALPLGVWKTIVCLRNNGTIQIYIDGVLNVSGTEGTLAPVYSYPARFGTMFYSGYTPPQYNGFNGKIDNVRIYNRALGPGEIIGILPIRLNSFAATNNHSSVLLNWQTAYEQQTSHFNLQRSTNGIDFGNVTTVQAKGSPTTETNYQYDDITVRDLKGVDHVFYRLEMVDKDGLNDFSSIVQVQLDKQPQELIILRNPVVEDLQLQFNSSTKENAQLIVSDAGGMQLMIKPIGLSIGTISTAIKFNTFPPGTYYVTLVSSQGKQSRSFIKQ